MDRNQNQQEKRIEDQFCLILGQIGEKILRLSKTNTVFISYAWEQKGTAIADYQKQHVNDLARYLTKAGIERVIYDQDSGSSTLSGLLKDVEHRCDFIILIGTPALVVKLNEDLSHHVIKDEVEIMCRKLEDPEWEHRIIPILLTGTRSESLPSVQKCGEKWGKKWDDLVYFDFSSVFESRKPQSSSSAQCDYYDCFFDLLIRLNQTTELARSFISSKSEFFRRELRELSLFKFPPSFSPYRRPKEKFDAFEDGTREWLIKKIIDLVKKDDVKAIFLLSEAGMGKSTLFGYMTMRFCEKMPKEDSKILQDTSLNIGALHFFNYGDVDDKSISFALSSVSFQLCELIPGFAHCLARDHEELEDNLKKYKNNMKALLNYLVLNPARTLTELGKQPSRNVIILLDALDECDDPVQFTKALHECFVAAPDWLVLVASSRSEDGVKQESRKDKIVELIPTQEENQHDLHIYIQQRMSRYLNPLDEAMMDELMTKSGGVFLWLSFQEKAIKECIERKGSFSLSDIKELPTGIEETYQVYFQRLFDGLQKIYQTREVKTLYRTVVSLAIILPRAPLPESIWKAGLGFTKSLDDEERYAELKKVISNLLVFSNKHLRAPHKSLMDWLSGDRKDENTAVGMGQFHLAIDRTAQKENHLKLVEIFQNIYSKVDPKLTYEFPDHPVQQVLTTEEQFAFTHVLYHCCESGQRDETMKWLLDFKHLFWLVYQAVSNNDYPRFVQDVVQVEEKLDSNLYYFSNLVRLSQTALEVDPRQLASQIVGRLSNITQKKRNS